jgi:hypothetical protein
LKLLFSLKNFRAENRLLGVERSSEISGYKLEIACYGVEKLRNIWLQADNSLLEYKSKELKDIRLRVRSLLDIQK